MLDKKIIDFDGLSRYHEKINEVFKTKQDVISDLDDIRSGAELGSTALQDIPDRSITFDKLDQDVLDELYGGLEIYSSVDELPDDAVQGSLASVAVNEPDIARPIEECYIKVTENPYLIKSLEYKESTEEWSFDAVFGAYGLDNNSVIPVEQMFNIYGNINNLNVWFNDNGDVEDTLISGGEINTELLNKICELISSLGGVVLYGTYDGDDDTNVVVTDIDEHSLWSLNQVFNFICAGTQETTLYIKDVNEWRNINEVKIVDSIGKLDKNAPKGSLASVVVNTINEVKFSELYQPTSDDVNDDTGVVDTTNSNLSSVSRISINSSYDTSTEIHEFLVYLFSKDFDMQGRVGQAVILLPGVSMTTNFSTQEQNQLELFTPNEDGSITVNEENLATINNLLSSTEFVYGGCVDEGGFVDMFYKAIGGIQKTELYIKDVNGWKVVGDEKLKAKVNNLQDSVDILGDIVDDLEAKIDNLEDKTDLIVNSVDELPSDAPLGSLASVITKEDKTELVPVSKAFVEGGAASGLTIVIPEKVDPTDFNAESSLGLNFSTNQTNRGAISVGAFSGKKCIFGTDGSRMPSMLAEYDSDGNLQNVNQSIIDTLLGTVTTYRNISGSDILDKYFFAPKNTILYKTKLYVKNSTGWEEIQKELKDNIVEIENYLNTIYNSVDDLPSDAPVGNLAKVMMVVGEKTSIKPLSEVVDGEIVNKLVIDSLPVSIDMTNIKNFLASTNPHGQNAGSTLSGIKIGSNSMFCTFMSATSDSDGNGFYFGTNRFNTSSFFHYKVNGTLNKFDQTQLDEFNTSIQGTNAQFYWNVSVNDNPALKETLGEFVSVETTEIIMSPTQYFKDTDGWKQISGEVVNDLEGGANKVLSAEMGKTLSERIEEVAENANIIVNSVDELPDDVPQGSLASVAVNKIDEVKFSELYQPTSDEVNVNTGVVDTTNLSSVSRISINSSYDISAEIQEFAVYLLSKDFDGNGGVGHGVTFGIELQEQQYIGMAMTISLSTQEQNSFELFTSNEDGTVTVNEENLSTINNLLSSTEFVYGGVFSFNSGEFIDPSYADVFYKAIGDIQKTELYIKDVKRWKKYIVDNLEDGGKDRALSANMGKVLKEMISSISFSSGADAVTFKGYVNVDSKDGIDTIFDKMKVGDAVLCVPSYTGAKFDEDSYLPWIMSGLNKNDESYRIPIDESLLSIDKSQFSIGNIANLIAGKGEIRTYFKLDADEPYAVCPDLLLLAKVKADLKDFMVATDGISSTIVNMIPDGTEMTACVGKVLRWSGGDWLSQHMGDLNNLLYPEYDNNLTHKYGYNYDMDNALETGIIGYTTICTSGLPSGIKENFTVIVNGSVDADPNYRTITQFAYGRTGSATNRVWTRVLFKAVESGYKDDFKPWVEISSEDLKSSISEIGSSLSELYQYIGEVDNKISDIEDIRSGAALGATALQEVPAEYVTESELAGKGYSTTTYVDEKVAALVNGAPDTLDTLDELAAALKDNKDIVTVLENSITSKQDKISDLETIRSGAALGATALQEVPAEYVTESELAGKGYVNESTLADYVKVDTFNNLSNTVNGKQDNISDLDAIRSGASLGATALQSVPSEYVTETELNNKGYVNESTLTDYVKVDIFNNLSNTVNGKQDKIGDLETIRSGASLGATALQEVPDGYVKESELAGMGYLKLDDLQFVEDSDIYTLFA